VEWILNGREGGNIGHLGQRSISRASVIVLKTLGNIFDDH